MLVRRPRSCRFTAVHGAAGGSFTINHEGKPYTFNQSGLVTIGYSGACLFAGTVDGTNQAVLVGAEVKLTTGFTGARE